MATAERQRVAAAQTIPDLVNLQDEAQPARRSLPMRFIGAIKEPGKTLARAIDRVVDATGWGKDYSGSIAEAELDSLTSRAKSQLAHEFLPEQFKKSFLGSSEAPEGAKFLIIPSDEVRRRHPTLVGLVGNCFHERKDPWEGSTWRMMSVKEIHVDGVRDRANSPEGDMLLQQKYVSRSYLIKGPV